MKGIRDLGGLGLREHCRCYSQWSQSWRWKPCHADRQEEETLAASEGRNSYVPLVTRGGQGISNIDQVLWRWAWTSDSRPRVGTRCGAAPLWLPSGKQVLVYWCARKAPGAAWCWGGCLLIIFDYLDGAVRGSVPGEFGLPRREASFSFRLTRAQPQSSLGSPKNRDCLSFASLRITAPPSLRWSHLNLGVEQH